MVNKGGSVPLFPYGARSRTGWNVSGLSKIIIYLTNQEATMKCPICDTKLRRMITDDPHIDHMLVDGWECPECGYDSVYDDEEPFEDDDEED